MGGRAKKVVGIKSKRVGGLGVGGLVVVGLRAVGVLGVVRILEVVGVYKSTDGTMGMVTPRRWDLGWW